MPSDHSTDAISGAAVGPPSMHARTATPPRAFQRLTNAERATLAGLLAKVVRDGEISADPLLSPNPRPPGQGA